MDVDDEKAQEIWAVKPCARSLLRSPARWEVFGRFALRFIGSVGAGG